MIETQPTTILIDGLKIPLGLQSHEPLVRAVVISLFTWRRANADDDLPADLRYGWWGDTYPTYPNDKIGSRLWLLARSKLTTETVAKAKEYAEEALQWLIDDGAASRVAVEAERQELDRLALACRIYRSDSATAIDIRFTDVWSFIK